MNVGDRNVAAIEVQGLAKRFGAAVAVDDLSFDAPAGAVTMFAGANGSGKTTTLRMLAGLVRPDAGTVSIHGRAYADLDAPRQVVGASLNRVGAHPGMRGRRHLEIVAASAGVGTNGGERIERLLAEVGLDDAAHRRLGTFSTGMLQRLSLAAALLFDPPVLLLDEPASGLDPQGLAWLRQLLRARADAGAAVLVSTHQLAELSTIADHLVVIDHGRLAVTGSAAEVLDRLGTSSLSEAVLAVTS